MQLLNALYVTTPESYLRLENNTLRVELDNEVKLRVPLHHLQSVVCFGHVGVSLPLMHRLADDGISFVMLDRIGRFKARLEGEVTRNVLLRQAQFRRAETPDFTLDTARAFVAGKIKNCRAVLLRGAREAKADSEQAGLTRGADDLAASLRALPVGKTLDSVRGVEGEAARTYFACLNLLLRADCREDFKMDGRTRRPPRDRFNALLSFIYSMWMNDCRSALEEVGLDPQVGFCMHCDQGEQRLRLI